MTELEIEVQRCSDVGEWPMIIGDMNAKVHISDDQLSHLSPNGKLLLQVVKHHQLSVLNFSEKCVGKLTHVVRTSNESSVLDYMITNQALEKTVKKLVIDEDCLLCPFWVKKYRGKDIPQYSDHNSFLLEMVIEMGKRKGGETEYVWRAKEDSKATLKTLTAKEVYQPPALCSDPQDNYNLLA